MMHFLPSPPKSPPVARSPAAEGSGTGHRARPVVDAALADVEAGNRRDGEHGVD